MSSYLLVTDSAAIAGETQELLRELLGNVVLEVVHEDGRLALARLERQRPDLALLPLDLRRMDVLTLLRALGTREASRIVLLTPDTLDGFRTAWEGLRLGARDLMPTKGNPPSRLKGHHDLRLRQLAWHLAHPGGLFAPERPPLDDVSPDDPLVLIPETRHLVSVAERIATLPRTLPVVFRAPEGARLRRVLSDEFARWIPWPTRMLKDGDRLTAGHVHLFAEPEAVRLTGSSGRCIARIVPNAGAPGSFSARADLLAQLASSALPVTLWVGEALEPEERFSVEAPGSVRVVGDEESFGRREEHAA